MRRTGAVLFVALLLGGGASARAQPAVEHLQALRESAGISQTLESWQSRLRRAETHLRQGRWEKARRLTRRVLNEMTESIWSGEGVATWLGIAAFYRGLADAGLGNEREAHWDLVVSQGLYSDLARLDLSPYGEAGRRFRDLRNLPPREDALDLAAPAGYGLVPPRRTHGPAPSFPEAIRDHCVAGRIRVSAIVDEKGEISRPEVVDAEGSDALLSFVALEAFRRWRFEPALRNGEPVAVVYPLELEFGYLKRCTPR